MPQIQEDSSHLEGRTRGPNTELFTPVACMLLLLLLLLLR